MENVISLGGLVTLIAAAGIRGQATWTQLTLQTAPPPRTAAAMVGDAARQQMVLFGGNSGVSSTGSVAFGDTWLWNGAWTQAQPTVSPAARWDHAQTYDAQRQRVVLFGGTDGTAAFGDLWEWDGSNWWPVSFLAGPQARAGHAMTFDAARQQVVLFGGGSNGTSLADTWAWNGVNWTVLTPPVSPPPRSQHAMAYDPVRQRVLVSGGHSGPTVLADTWEWDGATWNSGAPLPTTPGVAPGRLWHSMSWHPPSQRLLLAFGARPQGSGLVGFGDTWAYDGSTWTQVLLTGLGLLDQAIAFDPATQRLISFSGQYSIPLPVLNLTFAFNGTPAQAINYGAGCGNPPMSLISLLTPQPLIGTVARARVMSPPSPVVAVVFGSTDQVTPSLPLPVSLTPLGLTGCWLWHSADLGSLAALPTPNGPEIGVAVPPSTSLLGAELYLQAVGHAPGQNPAGLTTSDGLRWVIGNI